MVFRHLSDSVDAILATSHKIIISECKIEFIGYYLGKNEGMFGIPPTLSYALSTIHLSDGKSLFV